MTPRTFRSRHRPGLLAAGLTLVLMLSGCGGGTPAGGGGAGPGRRGGETYGANVNYLFTYSGRSRAQIDVQLRALRRTGATIARTDSLWERTEPAPPQGGAHDYHWSFDDIVCAELAAHHLRWEPIIDYAPAWAVRQAGHTASGSQTGHHPPTAVADYAAYAGAFAARYGPGGTFWRLHPKLPRLPITTYEIWNEPDNHVFWLPHPDAAAYAAMFATTSRAIRAAQPAARVIVGGLDHPARFLPAMLQADPQVRSAIAGVGVHPYAVDGQATLGAVASARRALAAVGLGQVPLYVTEFGWTTSPAGAPQYATPAARARDIRTTLAGLSRGACGVAAILLYTWTSPERNHSNDQEWYGIEPPGGGASPGVWAFSSALRAAAQAGPPRRCGG